MKKILLFISILGMFIFAGCSNNKTDVSSNSDDKISDSSNSETQKEDSQDDDEENKNNNQSDNGDTFEDDHNYGPLH